VPDLAAGVAPKHEDPGFFDRRGWLDRNERPVMTALSFLGNMLSSSSRTLAGSVGHGLAGAAQTWPGMGFKQQALDIEQQQADTQQIGKVQDAINLAAAQRAEMLRLNPQASTAAQDGVLKSLVGRMGELLKTPGMANLPMNLNYKEYMKGLPQETQAAINNINDQDNPWHLNALAAMPGLPPATRQEYIRLRDQAADRLRSGQARDKTGLQVVPAPGLTSALLQFQTQQQSASTTGAQLSPENRIATARRAATQILTEAGVSSPEHLTPEKRAQYEDLQRQIVTNQQAIGASTNPGVAPHQRGGRAGYDTGGLVPSGDDGGEPDVQMAQAAPLPPSANDQNDPEFWRKRGNALGGLGAKEESDAALRRAQEIEAARRDTGKRTNPKGETETNPGSIPTAQQQLSGAEMVRQNTKLRDELFERAQMGNQALQLAKELRTTMFDENGKPNSSMGPFNEVMNKAGGMFQQLGVPAHVLKSLNINVADKQASEKLQASIAAAIAHGDLGPNVRQSQFYTFMNAATPNMGMAPAAAQFIIDNVLIPRAQLEVDAYRSIKDLPPTENYQNRFYDWQLENPWYKGARIPKGQSQAAPIVPGQVPAPLRGISDLERSESTGQFLDRATGDVYAPDGKTKIGNIGKKP
jgi:hypothetical protein